MTKVRLNCTIDRNCFDFVKNAGLNISHILEGAIKDRMWSFQHTTKIEDCTRHQWTWPFCVPFGLAKECKKCGKFEQVHIKKHGEILNDTN